LTHKLVIKVTPANPSMDPESYPESDDEREPGENIFLSAITIFMFIEQSFL